MRAGPIPTLGYQLFALKPQFIFINIPIRCCIQLRYSYAMLKQCFDQEVIRVNRDFKFCAGCNCLAACDECQMTISVESPAGNVIGTVRQQLSCLPPCLDVMDSDGQVILRIQGPPLMLCPQFCDQKFDVSALTESRLSRACM